MSDLTLLNTLPGSSSNSPIIVSMKNLTLKPLERRKDAVDWPVWQVKSNIHTAVDASISRAGAAIVVSDTNFNLPFFSL